MLQEIKEGVELEVKTANERSAKYTEMKPEIKRIATYFAHYEVPVQRASISSTGLDINVSGDFSSLKASFAALRSAGYEPNERPTERKTSSFNTYFKNPASEIKIWFFYSSTTCTRKQIGTEMKEMPVYETVCE